jgi:hypothetical protein
MNAFRLSGDISHLLSLLIVLLRLSVSKTAQGTMEGDCIRKPPHLTTTVLRLFAL